MPGPIPGPVPFGAHRTPLPGGPPTVSFPHPGLTPDRFYAEFVERSVPVVLQGAAADVFCPGEGPSCWSDHALDAKFGATEIRWEGSKRESRASFAESRRPLAEFVRRYRAEPLYAVWDIDDPRMLAELLLPAVLRAPGFRSALTRPQLWFSSGGTSSVFHADGLENIHCVLDGEKTFLLVNKSHGSAIEHGGGFGWDAEGDASMASMDGVDLTAHPGFGRLPFHAVSVREQDCLYVPTGWYHQVRAAPAQRSLAVNVWFETPARCLFSRRSLHHSPNSHDVTTMAREPFHDEQLLTVDSSGALVGPGSEGPGDSIPSSFSCACRRRRRTRY